MILKFTLPRTASGEVVKLTPALKRALTGSLEGANERAVQDEARLVNPMRILCRLLCHACDHHWQAPALGACPLCHSATWVERLEEIVCMARRV